MLGADTDALRGVARAVRAVADAVDARAERLHREVELVEWVGADAERFRSAFDERVIAGQVLLVAALDARADELERQAAEQDAASMARSVSLGDASGASYESREAPSGPGAVDALSEADLLALAASGDPQQVADWFAELGYDPHDPEWVAAMQRLGARFPELIGDLEGAPYVARDAANRALLDAAIADRASALGIPALEADIAAVEAELAAAIAAGDERAAELWQVNIESLRDQLSHLERDSQLVALHQLQQNSVDPRQLVQFGIDTDGTVMASVADGNLDTATEVTVLVPGMNSSTDSIPDLLEAGASIRNEAAWHGLPAEGHVVIASANYNSPNPFTVGFNDAAAAGGERLGEDLGGLQAALGSGVDTNIVAHSYGTNVVDHALRDRPDAYGIDQVFFLGSAGLRPSDDANYTFDGYTDDVHWHSPYSYGDAELHASTSSRDPWAGVGYGFPAHPINPADLSEASGFQVFDTNPNRDPNAPTGSDGHDFFRGPDSDTNGYLDYGSAGATYVGQAIAND